MPTLATIRARFIVYLPLDVIPDGNIDLILRQRLRLSTAPIYPIEPPCVFAGDAPLGSRRMSHGLRVFVIKGSNARVNARKGECFKRCRLNFSLIVPCRAPVKRVGSPTRTPPECVASKGRCCPGGVSGTLTKGLGGLHQAKHRGRGECSSRNGRHEQAVGHALLEVSSGFFSLALGGLDGLLPLLFGQDFAVW